MKAPDESEKLGKFLFMVTIGGVVGYVLIAYLLVR